jgi:hypothetical protein
MFERASRLKLRIPYRGLSTVEDLWDMPLTDLDTIFKALNARVKEQEGESLLDKKTPENELITLTIALVKHVFEVRAAERVLREEKAMRSARKQKLLGIIAEKQDQELTTMSVEDLTKLVEEL